MACYNNNAYCNTKLCVLPAILSWTIFIAIPYGWCHNNVMYGMGVDLMTGVPESFVAGYMTFMNNFFVNVVYLVLHFFPDLGKFTRQVPTTYLLFLQQRAPLMSRYARTGWTFRIYFCCTLTSNTRYTRASRLNSYERD